MKKLIDVHSVRHDLPKQIRRTRALMRAELILEGKSTEDAKAISDRTHRRVYKAWIKQFADDHPELEDCARMVLKREGVL
ncbi:hypothetical protein GS624_03570 [Ruegeria sp. HKCCD5849]|uniref:hypothetical protein n=1 Tax=unclassified Ruegeria TaxID=2625375 RepID=UPI001490B8B2|nr:MULTISPECIES: hypothetical protein [unclassified Ruegeria]NOD46383.1 hypothetical protein [Ruegeria sp. HKCCD5849]NOD50317.1 hypothetical protein [Ruegeria sp. HKCCD5851]